MGAATVAATGAFGQGLVRRTVSPNEKLNIASIGCGGQGRADVYWMRGENQVAFCDVDDERAAKTYKGFPDVRRFKDYRKMFDTIGKDIDAVTVTIPDHSHAMAAITAMQLGKHVWVQKPLTHSIYEARLLQEAAHKYNVATQMCNQGHSTNAVREICEMIWSGVIGNVTECHIWTNRPSSWAQGLNRPPGKDPVPETLDWDAWLGPAPERPFVRTHPDTGNNCYLPGVWRGWWDFGCGALGDMGCHIMDAANMSLKLCAPTSVEVVKQDSKTDEQAPKSSVLCYKFPAREGMPPLTLFWYDGGNKPPRPAGIPEDEALGDKNANGTIFIGDKGVMTSGEYSGRPRLLPAAKMKDYKKPDPTLPRIQGQNHAQDWIQACKGGKPACSNFDYAAPFTEIVLLGNLALRTGKTIQWDAKAMKAVGVPEADPFIKPVFRKGWNL